MISLQHKKMEMDAIRNKLDKLKQVARAISRQLAGVGMYHLGPEVCNKSGINNYRRKNMITTRRICRNNQRLKSK
jgi:hypothetical protein